MARRTPTYFMFGAASTLCVLGFWFGVPILVLGAAQEGTLMLVAATGLAIAGIIAHFHPVVCNIHDELSDIRAELEKLNRPPLKPMLPAQQPTQQPAQQPAQPHPMAPMAPITPPPSPGR